MTLKLPIAPRSRWSDVDPPECSESPLLTFSRRVLEYPLRLLGSVARFLKICFPFSTFLLYWIIHLALAQVTLQLFIVVVVLLAWRFVSTTLFFWTRSIAASYRHFTACLTPSHGFALHRHTTNLIMAAVEYKHSPFVDFLISAMVPLLALIYRVPSNKLSLHSLGYRRHKRRRAKVSRRPQNLYCSVDSMFRRFLSIRPLEFPIAPNDKYWLKDTPENRCQIMGMAVLEKTITLQQLREVVASRFVLSDLKLTSRFDLRTGSWIPQIRPHRRYWADQNNRAPKITDYRCILRILHCLKDKHEAPPKAATPSPSDDSDIDTEIAGDNLGWPLSSPRPYDAEDVPDECFDISKHVQEICIDSNEVTVHQVLSEIASTELPPNIPPWKILVIQVCEASAKPSASCIVFQCHHGLGDGTSLLFKLLNNFFDQSAEVETFKASVKTPSTPKKALFLLYQCSRLLFFGLRLMWFWTIHCAKPPATFQHRNAQISRRRFKPTGNKYLSPPAVIPLREIKALASRISDLVPDFRPTINDIIICSFTRAIKRLRAGIATVDLNVKTFDALAPQRIRLRNSPRHLCTGESPINDIGSPSFNADERLLKTNQSFRKALVADKVDVLPSVTNFSCQFSKYVQIMMPMSTRLSLPTQLDNSTATVICRLPLPYEGEPKTLSTWHPGLSVDDVSPLMHLWDVKQELDHIKKRHTSWMFYLLSYLGASVLPEFIINFFVTVMINKVQLLVTNVRGPSMPLYFEGNRVKSLQFWPPAKGELTGGVAIFSFGEDLLLTTIFDEAELHHLFPTTDPHLSDLAELCQYLPNLVKKEFDALVQHTDHLVAKSIQVDPTSSSGIKCS